MAARRTNGEGSVYYNRERNCYDGQFYYDDPVTGEHKRKKLTGVSKSAVIKRGKEFLAQVKKEREEYLASQAQVEHVADWLNEWLAEYIQPSVRVKTYERYRCSINNHILPYIGKIPLDRLTTEDVQKMLNNLLASGGENKQGLSPRTVNAARRTLKTALDKAYHLQKISFNPVEATKACRTDRVEIGILSRFDAKKLLETAKGYEQNAYIAVLIALSTGMRIGEIFGLTWENVDLQDKKIYVRQSLVSTNHGYRLEVSPKTKAGHRQIDLPQYCVDALWKHRKWQESQKAEWLNLWHETGNVITNANGSCRDPNYFSYVVFKRLLETAGIQRNVRFHDLRHTHATWLLERGIHPKVVAERLGHSSIRITLDTYSHVIKGMQQTAVKKLDEIAEEW